MLNLKTILIVFIVFNSALGRDTRRGNRRHRPAEDEYKYNHPPAPENYEPIPVAVVYEEEINRDDKSIKNNATPENNVEQVNKEPVKPEPSVTEESNDFEVPNRHTVSKPMNIEEDEPNVTTYRPKPPQKEQQIPVAVVYDPVATYQKPNNNRATSKRRRIQRPATEEKQTAVEDTVKSGVYVNGHTGPISTANKPDHLNKRRKVQQTIPEQKQTIVDESISPSLEQKQYTPYDSTADRPEERQTVVEADIPTSEHANKYASSSTEAERPEQINKRQKIQRPARERQQTAVEDTTVQENGNIPSIPVTDKQEKFNNRPEGVQLLSQRSNSTRVREVIPIIQSENLVFSHSGNFQYSYEGGDGTKAFEKGELKTFDDENAGEAVSGGFSFKAKDGNEYSLSYTADENGYRPIGAHLPTPPPIPPAIARALAYLATKTTPEPVTESIAEYDQ